MKRNPIFAAAAALTLCPLALHAQPMPPLTNPAPITPAPAPASPAVTLKYKFAVGQVHRYQYDMDMQMTTLTGQTGGGIPMEMVMQMVMRQTVKSIRPTDGAATVVSQIDSMHMLMNGREMPLPAEQQEKMKQPFSQVMLPTGKILSVDVSALGGMGGGGMDFTKGMFNNFSSAAALPDGPVKVGDTWNGAGAMGAMGVEMASSSALTAFEQKNGATLAAIHSKQTGTIDKPMTEGAPMAMKMNGKVAGETIQVFDVTAGALQSMKGYSDTDMTMKFGKPDAAPVPGMPSAMKMQMHMKYMMQLLGDAPSVVAPTQ